MKKLITFFSFLILTSTVFANTANPTIGGWQVVSKIGQGIGAKLTATKEVMVNGASKVVTGTANLTPTPSGVARFMASAGGLALADLAVRELMNGVDFVLDPANNEVRKKVSSGTATNDNYKDNSTGLTGDALCFQVARDGGFSPRLDLKCTLYSSGTNSAGQTCFTASFYRTSTSTETNKSCFANATYTKPEEKYEVIPISSIATQIIDKAEKDIKAGNVTAAVTLTRSAVIEDAREAETDQTKARPIVNQLEKNQTYPTSEDATGTVDTPSVTDPVTGEVVKPSETSSVALKFPKACEWFPQVCVFIDWAMTDPNLDEELELPEKELKKQEIKKDLIKINSRSCPSDIKFDVDGLPFGIKITKGYSMQEICNTVEPFKYIFQLVTMVICCFILLRI